MYIYLLTWWRHQMEIFSALLALCAGNSLVTSEFPVQVPVSTRSFDVSFDLRLYRRLSKQSWGSLWRHCNGSDYMHIFYLCCFVLSCFVFVLQDIEMVVETRRGKQYLFIVHNQYHGCLWPDGTRSRDINIHSSDRVTPEYLYNWTGHPV